MRKILLTLTVLTLAAGMLPAQAATSTYTRTINLPTYFGGTTGAVSAPSVLSNPTDPSRWQKLGVVFARARCNYIKQQEGVLPPGTAQDSTTGHLGYVFPLPGAFGPGDSFTLRSVSPNPTQYDFDIAFYTSLGKCLSDVEVDLPAGQGSVTVPLEGSGPTPNSDTHTCNYVNTFTTIFDDSGTVGGAPCSFDANFAIVVMPIGAQGRFTLTLTY
jgi:hypothetical protein